MLDINEKIELLEGEDVWHTKTFNKLPLFMMSDGPHGLRKQVSHGDNLGIHGSEVATLFPSASLLASSFDRNLVGKMAKALARQAKSQGVNMVLGPGINIKRSPLCGRNFEYFSEDPYLTSELAVSYVKAIEAEGIGTSVKHFFANNQETNRLFIDTIVDKRALHEIYLKAFREVAKVKPASFMASYNKINGFYGTEHPYINELLRNKWNYEGVVVSDWGAINNRVKALKEGCDLEMPSSNNYHANKVKEAIRIDASLKKDVEISSQRIIDMINKYQIKENIELDLNKDHLLAEEIALESLVLLKNEDSLLPIKKDVKTALIGGFISNIRTQGGGSSHVNPYKVDQINQVYLNYLTDAYLAKGYNLEDDLDSELLAKEALGLSKEVDQIIYFMGLPDRLETEGIDRKHIDLPANQINLLKKIYEVNQNIVVVLLTGSVVDTSFKTYAKSILLAYLGGESIVNAIFKTLVGLNNPSGRLAESFINDLSIAPTISYDNYSVHYDESIFIGYRKYSSYNLDVSFPFGHGLSYSEIIYKDFSISENKDSFDISFKLQNKSKLNAKEVVQIYLENIMSKTYKAKMELVAFDKFEVKAKSDLEVKINVKKDNFAYFNIDKNEFEIEETSYKLHVSKNVDETLHTFDISIGEKNNQLNHQPWLLYNVDDFKKVYGKPLPPKNIKYQKPFDISSPLFALKETFMGTIMVNYILKEATKKIKDSKQAWMRQVISETLLQTPLRGIASFGGDDINFLMIEGIADLASNKLITGIRKLLKGKKELKDGR